MTINKSLIFEKELRLIFDKQLRDKTLAMIESLPDYFFSIPASSTGKYHPKYCLGEGGCVRHVKATVYFAKTLYELDSFKNINFEYCVAALLLHDGLKSGINGGKYSVPEHPILMHDFINELFPNDKQMDLVSKLVLTHMGQFNTDYRTKLPIPGMPTPSTGSQKFVAMCDYLASRKDLEVDLTSEYDYNNTEKLIIKRKEETKWK